VKDKEWVVKVTILVPREKASTVDEAIDLVGGKLSPLYWAGHISLGADGDQPQDE
jgi:hypothetical protein